MPFGALLAGSKILNLLNNGYQAVKKAGGVKSVIQNGWSLLQKGANVITANKQLGDAVVKGDIAVVDTPAGYLVTNKEGATAVQGYAKFLPWIIGGGLLLMLKK